MIKHTFQILKMLGPYLLLTILSNLNAQPAAMEEREITADKMRLLILPAQRNITEPRSIDIDRKVTSVIVGCATKLGRFEIIDRNNLEEILEEHALQLSGTINDSMAINFGRLATARHALLINVLSFSQVGVIPATDDENENDEDDDKSFLAKILGGLLFGDSDEEDYENNIRTRLAVEIRLIDIETGKSQQSVDLSLEHTGGSRGESRDDTIKKLRKEATLKLKELYLLSSEVMSADNNEVLLHLGSDVGVKKGTLFDIVSPDQEKILEDKTVTVPGRSVGIVTVNDISDESNRSSILRQWRPIKSGYRAVEHPQSIRGLQFLFSGGVLDSLMSFGAEFHWRPLRQLNWGFGLRFVRITDSFGNKDNGFGLGGLGSMQFFTFPKFKISGRTGLNLDIAFRKDDRDETVGIPVFSAPVGIVADFVLFTNSDISLFAGYRFSGRTDNWNRSSKGEESESGIWNNGAPQVNVSGFFVSVGYKIIFL